MNNQNNVNAIILHDILFLFILIKVTFYAGIFNKKCFILDWKSKTKNLYIINMTALFLLSTTCSYQGNT